MGIGNGGTSSQKENKEEKNCYHICQKCEEPPIKGEEGKIIEQNCKECKN